MWIKWGLKENKMSFKLHIKWWFNRGSWSKFGVWKMPLFKFLRHGDLKNEIFKSTGRTNLNIKYTNFDQLRCWECNAYEYTGMNVCYASTNAKMTKID